MAKNDKHQRRFNHNSKGRAAHKKEKAMLPNLCLVSKRMEAVVRPLLFSRVFIHHSTELILFHRTLSEKRVNVGAILQVIFTLPKQNELDDEFMKANDKHQRRFHVNFGAFLQVVELMEGSLRGLPKSEPST
ncbi:hypothetical protein Daus18300_000278 [Diaporthe australafricana]|uniref:Uncharacterized protein n=1 Tax=Diaporthe australafricana TaxID=127596 RepID=A0ABR3Y5K6_9PEZI